MSKLIRHLTRKSAGLMALMALLVAATGVMAGTPSAASASAASPSTLAGGTNYGKLNVSAYNAVQAQAGFGGISGSAIAVLNTKGEAIVKGTTDSKGFFSNYVQQGVYTLTVTAPGFSQFSKQIEIVATKSLTIQAALMPLSESAPTATPTSDSVLASAPGKFKVTIENISMSPVAIQATVYVYNQAGATIAKGETDPLGNFSTELAAGTYTVVVKATGFNNSKQQVNVSTGKLTDVRVTLTRIA